MMRIISGKYKGKVLEVRKDKGLRPTKGYIREMIFNLLMHGKFLHSDTFIDDANESRIEGRCVVDIFCGTGALGLEALSRGAAHLTLIDQNAETLNIARANVKNLGAEGEVSFIRSDSTQLPMAPQPCHLVFIDPPYGKGLMNKALQSLVNGKWLAHGAIVVTEQDKRDEASLPAGFAILDDRIHDKTRVMLLQYANEKE